MSVNVLGPAYVQYQHPSLAEAERFLSDFGFTACGGTGATRYFRGVEAGGYCYVAHEGPREFIAGGFEVVDVDALIGASRTIIGASPVRPLSGPGGGSYVELRDPDGFRIDLIAGRETLEPLAGTDATIVNFGDRKQRFGQFQRFERRPARVRRLGHFGFNVSSFERSFAWYHDNLGMTASDTLHAGPAGDDVAAFMRVDRGVEWVDHHSVFFLASPTTHVHHCSFEVQDPDEVMMGNEWLKARGWKPFWGVGRHILGSQVFDYWRDCSGFVIEHYADGDILHRGHRSERHDVADEALSVWGPPPPSDFLD
ncbi:VOC family protein (plasmid) [Polymorphobacter sp. PAMC 29334]|uniref:VOC family protein n=1 Tax=Polymorphobacter sp. PAMC 29334 TaxID=2862331 RepID=UPI001C751BE4|nr:VOC family protein [Polymorphobacter sp. PAMC 29334]QYE37112.1 VOC family protein [Polymorphobacter sp. PAMC 29334]